MSLPGTAFLTTLDALADRFEAATLGTPSGCPAVRAVYPVSAKSVPSLPAVVFEVQDGTVVANPGQWKHEWNVDVLLLFAKRPADPQTVETYRQGYLPYMLGATKDKLKLGLGSEAGWSVDKAIPAGWEWTEYRVADVDFDAIRVPYTVYVTESVTLTP